MNKKLKLSEPEQEIPVPPQVRASLKPCPWCGNSVELYQSSVSNYWFVRCSALDCNVQPTTKFAVEYEKSVNDWNSRMAEG